MHNCRKVLCKCLLPYCTALNTMAPSLLFWYGLILPSCGSHKLPHPIEAVLSVMKNEKWTLLCLGTMGLRCYNSCNLMAKSICLKMFNKMYINTAQQHVQQQQKGSLEVEVSLGYASC